MSSISITATNASTNAGLAQATAGAASDAANAASADASTAQSLAVTASAQLQSIPQESIVISNPVPSSGGGSWGVAQTGTPSGATWKTSTGNTATGSLSWTQTISAGTRAILVLVTFLGDYLSYGQTINYGNSNSRCDLTLSDTTLTSPTFLPYNGVSAGYPTQPSSYSGSMNAGLVMIPIGYSGTSLTLTLTWKFPTAIVDATSVPVGGTISGAFDSLYVKTISAGTSDGMVPAGALAVQYDAYTVSSATVPASTVYTGFVSDRTAANISTTATGTYGTPQSMLYGLSTTVASKKFPVASTFNYPAAQGVGSSRGAVLIMSTQPLPLNTAVGSFAQISNKTINTVSAGTVSANTWHLFPLGFFDTIDLSSPDISVDLAHATFTVLLTGSYIVQSYACADQGDGLSTRPSQITVNNALIRGVNPYRTAASGGGVYFDNITVVYLNAGDVVGIQWKSTGSGSYSFTRTGEEYFKLALLNRSHL